MAVARGIIPVPTGGGGSIGTADQGAPTTVSGAWPVKVVGASGADVAVVSVAGALKVDGSAVTQPVSGSVTASGTVTSNQGTAAATANAWPHKLVDTGGVNVATISAAGALKVDNSAVTQPVSGSVTVSGTTTSNQGTPNVASSAWPTKLVDAAGANVAAVSAAGAVKVDGSGATQPVSGSVTVSGTATVTQGAANTTANAWPIKITDGTNAAALIANASTGNAVSVSSGFITSSVTLNAVATSTNGTSVDAGSAKSNWTAFVLPTGTLTGNLSLEFSDDGTNWIPSGTTITGLTAATNVGMFSTGRASRYARVNLTGASGTGTLTVKMVAAG